MAKLKVNKEIIEQVKNVTLELSLEEAQLLRCILGYCKIVDLVESPEFFQAYTDLKRDQALNLRTNLMYDFSTAKLISLDKLDKKDE